jgi:hypothetical protein
MTQDDRNIIQRLADVSAALGPIMKQHVDAGAGGSYDAFAIDDIYAHVGPLLAKHGVVLIPRVKSVEYGTIEARSGAIGVSARVIVDYKLCSPDGSTKTVTFPAEGHDYQDKATNKAMQQAVKYGLIQVFQISTGEVDPDAAQLPDTAEVVTSEKPAASTEPVRPPNPPQEQASKPQLSQAEKRMSDLKNAAYGLVWVEDSDDDLKAEAVKLVEATLAVYGATPKNRNEVANVIEMMTDTMRPDDGEDSE